MLSDGHSSEHKPDDVATEPSEQGLLQTLQGAISSPEMSRDRFLPIFAQELHRAGFCCNGHVHHKICQESTPSTKSGSSRSVRQMRTPAGYRLSRQPSNIQQQTRSVLTDSPDCLTHKRSTKFTRFPVSPLRVHTTSEKEESATKIVEATGTSNLLSVEGLRLRHGLSQAELASILAMAETMFKPSYAADAILPGITEGMEDMKRWQEAVRMFSEHMALRPIIICRQHQKRDSETRMAIQGRHPEVEMKLREGYLKAVRRLEAFQEMTELSFPPNCNAFLEWTLKVKEREFEAFLELLMKVYSPVIMLLRQRREDVKASSISICTRGSLRASCDKGSGEDHASGCDCGDSTNDDGHDASQVSTTVTRLPALASEMSQRLDDARGGMQRYVSAVQQDEEKYRKLGVRLFSTMSGASNINLVDDLFGLIPKLLRRFGAPDITESQNRHENDVVSDAGCKTSVFPSANTWPPTVSQAMLNTSTCESDFGCRSSVLPFWNKGRWQVAIMQSVGARVLIDPWGLDGYENMHRVFASLERTVPTCKCPDGSKTRCSLSFAPSQEVLLPVYLPKTVKKQSYMKQHSVAIAWWATIEILCGRIDHKMKQLKELNRLDWSRQQGIMAEALHTSYPGAADYAA